MNRRTYILRGGAIVAASALVTYSAVSVWTSAKSPEPAPMVGVGTLIINVTPGETPVVEYAPAEVDALDALSEFHGSVFPDGEVVR